MNHQLQVTSRRRALAAGGKIGLLAALVASGFVPSRDVLAQQWPSGAFATKGIAATLKALGATGSVESRDIKLEAPDVTETGGQVTLSVTSQIPKTESIAILIENNPHALSSVFEVPSGTDPFLSINVKLAESSQVYALVKAGGRYFHARQQVRVTVGGCGQ